MIPGRHKSLILSNRFMSRLLVKSMLFTVLAHVLSGHSQSASSVSADSAEQVPVLKQDLIDAEEAEIEQAAKPRLFAPPEDYKLYAPIKNMVYGQQEENGIRFLQAGLKAKLDYFQKFHDLNASELEKLSLAGHGEIARFASRVAAFQGSFSDVEIPAKDVQRFLSELAELQRLKTQENLFGKQSLLGKTLRRVLAQKPRNPNSEHKTRIAIMMSGWINSNVSPGPKLRIEQRTALTDLMKRRIQNSRVIVYGDWQEIAEQLAEISDAELETVLDPAQMLFVGPKLNAHRKQYPAIRQLK